MKWQDAMCIRKAIACWHLRYCSRRKMCCSEWAIYYSIQHFSYFPSIHPHILRYDHASIAFHLSIIRNSVCRESEGEIWTLLMSKTFCWDQGFTSTDYWPATWFDQQVPDAHVRSRSVPYQVHASSRVLPQGMLISAGTQRHHSRLRAASCPGRLRSETRQRLVSERISFKIWNVLGNVRASKSVAFTHGSVPFFLRLK